MRQRNRIRVWRLASIGSLERIAGEAADSHSHYRDGPQRGVIRRGGGGGELERGKNPRSSRQLVRRVSPLRNRSGRRLSIGFEK